MLCDQTRRLPGGTHRPVSEDCLYLKRARTNRCQRRTPHGVDSWACGHQVWIGDFRLYRQARRAEIRAERARVVLGPREVNYHVSAPLLYGHSHACSAADPRGGVPAITANARPELRLLEWFANNMPRMAVMRSGRVDNFWVRVALARGSVLPEP